MSPITLFGRITSVPLKSGTTKGLCFNRNPELLERTGIKGADLISSVEYYFFWETVPGFWY